ncbi:patatin-like phospholipase family protein [Urechidicola vernalis]|uniref:Patatin-like phospholipase family protein n=1 Tax=Urechidicola vernalis TaxID=3075600 RepID=A0ABU2Y140_9FLAO|nr:patatin-like phospholipase family protein [Urechidicola sp. P050]MDT0551903.1 patatin-like phospholipase family protein [Urechidicola sp. P050]
MKEKKALVISGGGSKGAFAGGVAQYLIQNEKKKYDLFLGTSTGSLMVIHLALGKLDELKEIYTNVSQRTIFSNCPITVKKVNGNTVVGINHLNVIWNFLRGRKTFGESKNLRRLIRQKITENYFNEVKTSTKDAVVTVSNISSNSIEYKSVDDCTYDDFRDWIWASCNYVPFMSLMRKNGCHYADGGFGCLVPIREAIKRGAKEVDVIILETELTQVNRIPAKSPFSVLMNTHDFMMDHVEKHNITIGKLYAKQHDVKLNLYYTPTVLTTNSLVFDKKLMSLWWSQGFKYAKNQHNEIMNELKMDLE